MTTHISYETAKRLKEFLGDKAPEPIKGVFGEIWLYDPECPEDGILQGVSISAGDYPAYQLHDLLSKEFCEAFGKVRKPYQYYDGDGIIKPAELKEIEYPWSMTYDELSYANKYGGIPAVEKELMRMMEGK